MKDENTQVPDTFDEQEELRSEKRGLRLYFSGLVCCLIAFGFIIAGIFFQKYNVKNGDAIAIGGFVIFGIAAVFLIVKNIGYALLWEADRKEKKTERSGTYFSSCHGQNDFTAGSERKQIPV